MTTNHGFVTVGTKKTDFPKFLNRFICWNVELENWCARRRHASTHVDPFWVDVLMTKRELIDFLCQVWGPDWHSDLATDGSHHPAQQLRELKNVIDDLPDDDSQYLVTGFDY